MKDISKTIFGFIFFALFSISAFSQASSDVVEMADSPEMKSKIYVVVAVLLVIFIGLAIFLISIDRKVRRLEKKDNSK
jgi:hypothetical protein